MALAEYCRYMINDHEQGPETNMHLYEYLDDYVYKLKSRGVSIPEDDVAYIKAVIDDDYDTYLEKLNEIDSVDFFKSEKWEMLMMFARFMSTVGTNQEDLVVPSLFAASDDMIKKLDDVIDMDSCMESDEDVEDDDDENEEQDDDDENEEQDDDDDENEEQDDK